MKWFRMYSEFVSDPKVQMLSEADQRRFIMLMCIRCNEDVTLHDTEVAFQLRINEEEWSNTKAILISRNLITKDNRPVSWDKRQFKSDDVKQRVKTHRDKAKQSRNVTSKKSNVLDTEPDSDTKTDTDLKLASCNETWAEEVLPSSWHDYAETKNIPDEQIYRSWKKFKEVSVFPYDLQRWQAWIDRERVQRVA